MIEGLWSVLILICVGLALAHIVTAASAQPSAGESVIEGTFTANKSLQPRPLPESPNNQQS
jgi:hypothetical protein